MCISDACCLSIRVKNLIRLLILDTDMAVHSKLEQAIKNVAHQCHASAAAPAAPAQEKAGDAVCESSVDPSCQESTVLLRAILHAADLSSLCK
eukprot:751724-Hanusia_phi.AAC.1